jgi:hypothetical protein
VRIKEVSNRLASASLRDLIARAVRGRGPVVTVQRRTIPYWQERGWVRDGSDYRGNYQTKFAVFCGFVVEGRSGYLEFYLYAPSEQIRRHSHWTCFVDRGDDWYFVHMGRQPRDLSSGIITIERLISEAYAS